MSGREKGLSYQLKMAKKIAGFFGVDWKQCLQSTPESGARGAAEWKLDLCPLGDFAKTFPFQIECKKQEICPFNKLFRPGMPMIVSWFDKAERENTTSRQTLLVYTTNYMPDLVMFRVEMSPSTENVYTKAIYTKAISPAAVTFIHVLPQPHSMIAVMLLDEFLGMYIRAKTV